MSFLLLFSFKFWSKTFGKKKRKLDVFFFGKKKIKKISKNHLFITIVGIRAQKAVAKIIANVFGFQIEKSSNEVNVWRAKPALTGITDNGMTPIL